MPILTVLKDSKNRYFHTAMLLFWFCFLSQQSDAQMNCGTDIIHQRLMETDPEYKARMEKMESQIQAIVQKEERKSMDTSTVYTIPVVVHVIHLGEEIGTGTNISDSLIHEAILGLNQQWRNMIGNGVDMEIEFCLAARDTLNNPTTGINRVDGSVISNYTTYGIELPGSCFGANEVMIKDLSRWPVADYYNIWVVSEICNSTVGGYAPYPFFFNYAYDGTVIDYRTMNYESSTLAHECGHGFGLYHTFESINNVNCSQLMNMNCSQTGDRVCDTPPHTESYCQINPPCSWIDDWDNSRYNYMSYCPSSDRFTIGQKYRSRAFAIISPRASLLSSLGCLPPTQNDASIASIVYPLPTVYISNCNSENFFEPIVELKNTGSDTLSSVEIVIRINNTELDTIWEGNLPKTKSVLVKLPAISIGEGNHIFEVYTSNPNMASDEYSLNDTSQLSFVSKFVNPFKINGANVIGSCEDGFTGSAEILHERKTEIIEDWEGASDWIIVNGDQTNKWVIGNATSNGGEKSIYISNNGTSNQYSTSSTSTVHFYKDFYFPADATNITIKFDIKGSGNSSDYVDFLIYEQDAVNSIAGYRYYNQATFITKEFTSSQISNIDSYAGTSKRIVFRWHNNSSGGSQPPAAIDNIIVRYNRPETSLYTFKWDTNPQQISQTAIDLSPGNYLVTVTDDDGCYDVNSVNVSIVKPFKITSANVIGSCEGGLTGSAEILHERKTVFIEDWEGASDWIIINGNETNRWVVGSATSNGGEKSIYISNDGTSNQYNSSSTSIVHFYKDFYFPSDATDISLSFDWKCDGNSADLFLITIGEPDALNPSAGDYLSFNEGFLDNTSYTTKKITDLFSASAGTSKRIVFTWVNNSFGGSPPPAAIDNIIVSYNRPDPNIYTYQWNTNPQQFTKTASELSAGNYLVTVIDNDGCSDVESVKVDIIKPFKITGANVIGSCEGGLTGSAEILHERKTEIIEDWEGASDWVIVNGNETNKWIIGNATSNGGEKSIYISNNGTSNQYSTSSTSTVHFYKDFYFPVDATNIAIKFDVKVSGNSSDYLDFLIFEPDAVNPSEGYRYYNQSTFITKEFTSSQISSIGSYAGTSKRIVFRWHNNSSGGTQPPAAIDNIIVSYNRADTSSYNYAWNTDPPQNLQSAINLSAGNYLVTVTDDDGCYDVESVNVNIVNPFKLSSIVENATCNISEDGSIEVFVEPQTEIIEDWEGDHDWIIVNGDQTNKWIVGSATSNGGAQSIYISSDGSSNYYNPNVSSDVYFYKDFYFPTDATDITIKFDFRGSGSSADYLDFLIYEPDAIYPVAGFRYYDETVFTSNVFTKNTYGITDIESYAGTTKRILFNWINNSSYGSQPPAAIDNIIITYNRSYNFPYEFEWNTDPVQLTSTASGLNAGIYQVTVTDREGCIGIIQSVVEEQFPINIEVNQLLNPLCPGESNGSINIQASGGIGGYTYDWNNGQYSTNQILDIPAGMYAVQVTDSEGCTHSVTYELISGMCDNCGTDAINVVVPIPDGTHLSVSDHINFSAGVDENATVIAQAENYIQMNPGFSIPYGSQASFLIAPCMDMGIVGEQSEFSKLVTIQEENSFFEVQFEVTKPSQISLSIFNQFGELVQTILDNQSVEIGKWVKQVDLQNSKKGVYLIVLTDGEGVVYQNMVVID